MATLDNEKAVQELKKLRKNIVDLRQEINQKLEQALRDNIKGIRSLVTNITLISGAIAAFSLTLYTSDLLKNPNLLTAALLSLLFCIWFGVFYLKSILENENKKLDSMMSTYNSTLTEAREAIDKALNKTTLETVKKALETYNSLTDKLADNIGSIIKYEEFYIRHVGDIQLGFFTLSLLLIVASFI